jgi:hypothetical protein
MTIPATSCRINLTQGADKSNRSTSSTSSMTFTPNVNGNQNHAEYKSDKEPEKVRISTGFG